MNRVYRLIWNQVIGAWVCCAENCKGRGKSPAIRKIVAAFLALIAPAALAAPTGGVVAAGTASIVSNGTKTTITQTSGSATYNWQTFNIAKTESVHFQQPGASSVALNYVLGNQNSLIDGSLTSNGQVFLSNPNGILFGSTAQVNVAGLTLDAGGSQFGNAGHINVNGGGLIANASLINNTGLIEASSATLVGGRIVLTAGTAISNTGSILANGLSGGAIALNAGSSILQMGSLRANGSAGAGGMISLSANYRIVQAANATTDANGLSGGGVSYRANAASLDSSLLLSGAINANGIQGNGGNIVLTANAVELAAANLNANGSTGGSVSIGGGFQGLDATISNAQTTTVNAATNINARGSQRNGGSVVVWSDVETRYSGNIDATGGVQATAGGRVEVSGKQNLGFNGRVSASSANGVAGTLLLDPANITIQSGVGGTPAPTVLFNLGKTGVLTQLPNGNWVIANELDSTVAPSAGAVWMFDGKTGALLSTLTGAVANDRVGASAPIGIGGGVGVLPNGNYLIGSPYWQSGGVAPGALTWASATTGVSGVVSAANSIVGQVQGEVGALDVSTLIALPSGNYLWRNPTWSGTVGWAGAVSFIKGNAPTVGTFRANSLVGGGQNDSVGSYGVTVLANGNYLVASPQWNIGTGIGLTGMGAVTWGSGTTGVVGVVSSTNSLVGSTVGDGVGQQIQELTNGNYVVVSPLWSNGAALNAGAVTWGNGATGVSGVISATNSLVGSQTSDAVGMGWGPATGGVKALSNGNYLVVSPSWDNAAVVDAGALTWGSGSAGVVGTISASNSIVGQATGDIVGLNWANSGYFGTNLNYTYNMAQLVNLPNGNMLFVNPYWNNGAATNAGAVTFISGNAATSGTVRANSLVGSSSGDMIGTANSLLNITVLPNGNYVVNSPAWNNGTSILAGAVTWGSGTLGAKGVVSAANSLVGTQANDQVGAMGITVLSSGNFLISSRLWGGGKGAVTWGNGANGAGVKGAVSAVNSLVGGQIGDHVGQVTQLANGNYLISSTSWGNGRGEVTWGSGVTGVKGVVSAANSLVGGKAGDSLGSSGVIALPSGNYLVQSPLWDRGAVADAGAVTWGSGVAGVKGVVTAANSLIGASVADMVGLYPATILPNGDYLLLSPLWDNGVKLAAGAVTRGSGQVGVRGGITAANSLVGTQTGDSVGVGGVTLLPNGNYLISSPLWANGAAKQAGAVTWVNGATGLTGAVSAANSLVGARTGDRVGYGSLGVDGITVLSNGNYLVSSPNWSNGVTANVGALTWGSGATGVSGVVSSANSIVGQAAGEVITAGINWLYELPTGNYLWRNQFWNNGTATNAGAVTFLRGNAPTTGTFRANSLVGSSTNDQIGSNITALSNGNFLIVSPTWSNGAIANAGALTWGSGFTGVTGIISATNSIVGDATGQLSRGIGTVTALPTGNYVIADPAWGYGALSNAGAVTFIKGNAPTTGSFLANSLTGTSSLDSVGNGGVIVLPSGNYLVRSDRWTGGLPVQTPLGAVTWGSGVTGVSGAVSSANSLVGSTAGDYVGGYTVTVLSNGNYLVGSPQWSGGAGAITWGNGATGVSGVVSSANSLVGAAAGDSVGGFVVLANGNYVSAASNWGNKAGAVTWGSGTTGVVGVVSAANSLVGSTGRATLSITPGLQGDQVGNGCGEFSACNGVIALSDGNYIVRSANWSNGATNGVGAVTWVDGSTGMVGAVSAANSYVGAQAGDRLGSSFNVLDNGNVAFAGTVTPWTVYSRIPTTLGYAWGPGTNMILDPTAITSITSTGTAVTLQASNDITVNSDIITTLVSGVAVGGSLTLSAGRSVLVNANIDTAGGGLSIVANDLPVNGVVTLDRAAGAGVISQGVGSTINTGSGLLTMEMRGGGVGGAITLGNINAGALSVGSAVGSIGQVAGSHISVLGGTTLTADNGVIGAGNTRYAINLVNAGNNFAGPVVAIGNGVSLASANNMTVTLTDAGNSLLTAGGSLDVSGGLLSTGAVSLNFGQSGLGGTLTLPTLTTITGASISAVGGAGVDRLVASADSVAITLGASSLSSTGSALISLSGIEAATLSGGVGANAIDVSQFAGTVVVDDSVGGDVVVGNGTQTTLVGQMGANAWTVTGLDAGNINGLTTFSGVGNLSGGSGSDAFTINAGGSLSGGISASAGVDTITNNAATALVLRGRDLANQWLVNAANGGGVLTTGLDSTTFTGVSSLRGGAGDDVFMLSPAGSLAGTIDGGAGANSLIGSSAYSVTGMDSGSATGVGVGFLNVGNLSGSTGNDVFTFAGGALSTGISGGGGADTLRGITSGEVNFVGGGSGSVDVAALTASGLSISGATGITFSGALNTGTGAVTVSSLAGISESAGGTIASSGLVSLNDVSGMGISLSGANAMATLSANAGAGGVTVNNVGSLQLGNVSAASLTLNNNGNVSQVLGSTIAVTGGTSLSASNGLIGAAGLRYAVALSNAGNDFGGAVNAIGSTISVVDGMGGLTFGNVRASGNLVAVSRGGAIGQAALTNMAVGGAATISASNGTGGRYGIVLNNATNNFVGAVSANGAAITLRDINALQVALNGTGAAMITTAGPLSVSGTLVGPVSNLVTRTTGLAGTTTLGAMNVGGALRITSSKPVRRLAKTTPIRVAGILTTPVATNRNVVVNGVIGAKIP